MMRLSGWSGEGCRRICAGFGVLIISLGIVGCGVSDRLGKRVDGTWAGDILFSHTDRVKLSVEGADYLNPDERDEPLSVVLRVYQLSSLDKFRSAGSEQLWGDDLRTLSGTVLDTQEITLVPGKSREAQWPMAVAARYVAVAAFFRNERGARWKVALPADAMRKDGVLFSGDGARLLLEGNTLVVVRGEDSLHPLRSEAGAVVPAAPVSDATPVSDDAREASTPANPLLQKAGTVVRESAEEAATNAAKRQATSAMEGALP